ncbi:UDP:flavonoid glycosyltransferase YjiC, YdhE family [Pseudonocardia ammonioxydans]|uniref:UDP:flavonoid glycosyltransferase YjiC, YdhE family n=1 Tax=Pseudonocardia ammonioxydans TaxID=260086 RepID=A0A1I5G924_PSUAM|nr:glycosyltransferase [Pseudonocardia ammonioxydans]SFO32568.1 UDP:flavonoid glycosyltransferase YjiC, YdhE family [Pseudonocardia ammonioxydans]
MRVLIAAVGSRGDVAPCVGIGERLRGAGHTVTIAAHPSYAAMVRAAGLECHPLPGDLGVLLDLPERSTPAYQAGRVPRLTTLLREAARATYDAAAHADLLLTNGSAPFGYDVAEARGIPGAGVYCQPMTPTGDFPPIVLHSARSWGRPGNRLLGSLGVRSMIPFHRATAELRRDLGLPRRSVRRTQARQAAERWPILHGYSPAVLPRPADWRPGLDVVGYWWPPATTWEPPAELTSFLAGGPPPVFVGFGSMAGGHGARLAPLVVAALRRAGMRGVLQAGRAGLGVNTPDGFGPDVLAVDDVPHEWLFPQVAAVVHHAGAGTTGATLRAGVPSVPAPVFADQPLWSRRLVELGCAPEVIPFRRLDAGRLAEAVRAAVREPRHRAAAQVLQRVVTADDGAGAVVELVERLAARS